jgi:hypothetical protein
VLAGQSELDVPVAQTGSWLPDETLFSLASRFHRVTGHRWAASTCQALFGHSRIGSAHDLPARVDEFASRTRGCHGDSIDIIWRHTVLPYFLPYRSAEIASDAIAAMRGPSIGSLKFRLGLVTSRFRAHLPLKACRRCIERDFAAHNVAYWHRRHQFPGVWVCHLDGVRLHQHEIKVSGESRFDWVLPDELPIRDEEAPAAWPLEIGDRLARLAYAAQSLGDLPYGTHFDSGLLSECHHQALASRGFVGRGGRLQLTELAESYHEFVAGLQIVPEFANLPIDKADARTQISRMLYRHEDGTHPLRQLILTVWLHGSWANFSDRYRNLCTATVARAVGSEFRERPAAAEEDDPRVKQVVVAVRDLARSPTAVASELGVDVSTVVAWLAREGIASSRRPKKLKRPMYEQAVRLLQGGSSKAEVADQLQLSASTVTKLLRSEPGLRSRWNESRLTAARTEHRKTWQDLIHQNPSSPTQILRAVAAKAYAWLYRNDRVWLVASIAARAALPPKTGARIDWDTRDGHLASEVRKAAEQICANSGRQRCTVAAICASVPELRAKLGALEKLPLTVKAIGDTTWPRRSKATGTLL